MIPGIAGVGPGEIEVANGARLSLRRIADVAGLASLCSFHDLLLLLRARQDTLREDLERVEKDEDLLQAAREYRVAAQIVNDVAWWPQHCATILKEIEENATDTGRAVEGVGGEGEGT